jgi:hypothetical protein
MKNLIYSMVCILALFLGSCFSPLGDNGLGPITREIAAGASIAGASGGAAGSTNDTLIAIP